MAFRQQLKIFIRNVHYENNKIQNSYQQEAEKIMNIEAEHGNKIILKC